MLTLYGTSRNKYNSTREYEVADTLVLNADAKPYSVLPLSTVSWQESVKYFILDKVVVLEWYDDWVVSSPTWETKVPAVVMVKKYVRKNSSVRLTKFNIYLRDMFDCQYCGEHLVRNDCTIDHVLPISKGGGTTWTNCVTACGPCNTAKGNKLLPLPNSVPYKPTYYDLVKNKDILDYQVKHESWKNYIY